MIQYTVKYKRIPKKYSFSYFVLGCDIGGTNTNIGFFGVRNSVPEMLFSLNFKSQQISSLVPAINASLDYALKNHKISVREACIAGAGPVSMGYDYCSPVNLKWDINAKYILESTSLKSAFIINDFEALGYSINLLNVKKSMFKIRHNAHKHRGLSMATKAIIGGGTGLGKCILIYSKEHNAYLPMPSEGGHIDFPAQNNFEIKLLDFIKNHTGIGDSVSCEEILTGKGIEYIYLFLKELRGFKNTEATRSINSAVEKAPLISKFRNSDSNCKETFRLYTIFYARIAKNFALDVFARGGLYISGGIAAKNSEIFRTEEFIVEFERVGKVQKILQNIPIWVLTDYGAGMCGAAYAAVIRKYYS